jgi:CHAT domain-containing protein
MALETIERLEREVQRAEDQCRAGNTRAALESYCRIFQDRWSTLGGRVEALWHADLLVIERLAEISLPFGKAAQADTLFLTAAEGYMRLGLRYWFDYLTLKRVHLALSGNDVSRARDLLRELQPSAGDLEALALEPNRFEAWEASYTGSRDPSERQTLFANLYLQLGRIAMVLGRYGGAIAALERGMVFAESDAPLARSAKLPLELTLVRAHIERGELEAGAAELARLRTHIDERSQPSALTTWLELAATLDLLRGDFGRAQDRLVEVWQLSVAHEFLSPALRAFLNLAQVLVLLNKTVEAKRLLALVAEQAGRVRDAEAAAEAARLRVIADARAQRDNRSGPQSVTAMQGAGSEEGLPRDVVDGEFRVETSGRSYQDFQLRTLQFQYYLGSGREMAATRCLERLDAFRTTDSALVELGLAALHAAHDFARGEFLKAASLAAQIAPAYRKLGMRPEQWRVQSLWKRCLEQTGSAGRAVDELAADNERLLAEMAASLSLSDRIVFLLNKPTEEEEYLARKIRVLQEHESPPSGFLAGLLHKFQQMRRLNDLLDDVFWQREAISAMRLRPETAQSARRPVTSLARRLLGRGRDQAALIFVVLPDSVLVITEAFGRLRHRVVRTARARIRELVRMWHEAIPENRPDQALLAARLLARELQLDAALSELPRRVQRLAILPDDVLHGFSFAAIKIGDQHLIERFALSIAFQPTRRKVPRRGAATASPFIVGMTAGSPPLPKTGEQLEFLRGWFAERGRTITPLLNEAAAPRTLLDGMQKATLLHISCHGEYVQDHPELTGWQIVTAPGRTEIVGLNRMFQLDLRRMQHATLISCWAADNFVLPGRWVISLPEVLWRAGAGSIVGSLWQVSEDCAGEFVRKFYQALASQPVDRAAQQAILSLMRSDGGLLREPVEWAGFQVYGEPRKLRLVAS